jgi:hypothetical protein
VSTALLWASSPWRPRFLWSRRSFAELRGLSGAVFGTNILFYLNRNVDNLLISRFLGAAALGMYSLAYNVMLVPLLRLVSPIGQVLFPAFSRMDDERAVGALWLRVTRVTAALTVPAFVGLAVVAPDFVPVVLGSKWNDAVPVMQVLAWVGLLQAVAWETQGVLTALGRARTITRYALVSATLTVTAFAIGVTQGIVAVAVAYAIVTTLLTPFYIGLGIRATRRRLRPRPCGRRRRRGDHGRGTGGPAPPPAGRGRARAAPRRARRGRPCPLPPARSMARAGSALGAPRSPRPPRGATAGAVSARGVKSVRLPTDDYGLRRMIVHERPDEECELARWKRR